MKIFISHSSKNQEIVLLFAEFLESINSDIEVFCSSENRSISIGSNFVEKVFEELSDSNLFIPIISREYYESKFCMIELGVAYSYLYEKYRKQGEDYIFPFALYPLTKSQALAATPLQYIQTGELCGENDIRNFLEYLKDEKGIKIGSGLNRKLHSYKVHIDEILLKKQNILDFARIGTYFDDSVEYKQKSDIVYFSNSDGGIIVNFNMNPYEAKKFSYPNFVSLALRFVDTINLSRYLDFNDAAAFEFELFNFTNSLKRIFIEFKYPVNQILDTFEYPLEYGVNKIRVSLKEMRSKALEQISEICFVIHPDDIVEDEGMFKISDIQIR